MRGWKVARMGVGENDPNFEIDGVRIWTESWKRVPVNPVSYHAQKFFVYELEGRPDFRFACTEISASVFGFLVPKKPEEMNMFDRLTPLQIQMIVGFVLGVLTIIFVVAVVE